VIGELLTASALLLGAQDGRARIAYAHGDGIYSVASDGSDRRPLARGDEPAFSPSGDALAFSRAPSDERATVWAAAPDGTQARELVGSTGNGDYASSPAWSPDGTRIAFTHTAITETSIVTSIELVGRDGSGRRTVVRLPARRGLETVSSPVWTPDGRLLYTRTRWTRDAYRFDIRSVAADGSGDGLFLRDAAGGAFSPDGTRLAYEDSARSRGDTCGSDECYRNGDLAVAAADGSGRRVLFRSESAEGGEAWSPDGMRIAFESGRNVPGQDYGASEIYTIAPDGSCLTWLTNGTASASPAWMPGGGVSAAPGCGGLGRPPLVEVAPTARARGSYWPGPALGAAFLSEVQGRGRETAYFYDDCSAFDPEDCPRAFSVTQQDSCRDRLSLRHLLRASTRTRRIRGGALLVTSRNDGGAPALVLTGRSAISVRVDAEQLTARDRALVARVVAALRPYGASRPGRLPKARVAASLRRYVPGARACS
jgi:WD40-like Beta Propeller Repeat